MPSPTRAQITKTPTQTPRADDEYTSPKDFRMPSREIKKITLDTPENNPALKSLQDYYDSTRKLQDRMAGAESDLRDKRIGSDLDRIGRGGKSRSRSNGGYM
jgi:hypothetical protein